MSRLSFARVSFVMMFVAMVLPCGHFLSTICLSGMRRLRHWLVNFAELRVRILWPYRATFHVGGL